MARPRAKAAVRKAAARALETARASSEPNVIAEGVRSLAVDLEPHTTPGALYWTAPMAYIAEQAAPRICRMAELPAERVDDVAAYMHAALNEYVVALVDGFDSQHFEAWIAAQKLQFDGARPGQA